MVSVLKRSPHHSEVFNMKSDEIITKIRNKLQESDPEKRSVTNVFQFNFTDTDGKCIKKMVFDFKDLSIYEGTRTTVDAEITVSDEDFYSIGTHEKSFDELLANKRAHVEGNAEAIHKMMEKFRLNHKK